MDLFYKQSSLKLRNYGTHHSLTESTGPTYPLSARTTSKRNPLATAACLWQTRTYLRRTGLKLPSYKAPIRLRWNKTKYGTRTNNQGTKLLLMQDVGFQHGTKEYAYTRAGFHSSNRDLCPVSAGSKKTGHLPNSLKSEEWSKDSGDWNPEQKVKGTTKTAVTSNPTPTPFSFAFQFWDFFPLTSFQQVAWGLLSHLPIWLPLEKTLSPHPADELGFGPCLASIIYWEETGGPQHVLSQDTAVRQGALGAPTSHHSSQYLERSNVFSLTSLIIFVCVSWTMAEIAFFFFLICSRSPGFSFCELVYILCLYDYSAASFWQTCSCSWPLSALLPAVA